MQHLSCQYRSKGRHAAEIEYWSRQLGACSFAIRFGAYSARTFFVLNADAKVTSAAKDWVARIGEKAEFVPFSS